MTESTHVGDIAALDARYAEMARTFLDRLDTCLARQREVSANPEHDGAQREALFEARESLEAWALECVTQLQGQAAELRAALPPGAFGHRTVYRFRVSYDGEPVVERDGTREMMAECLALWPGLASQRPGTRAELLAIETYQQAPKVLASKRLAILSDDDGVPF